ncbi:hypothetical protein [Actinomycetospora sp. CA-084318]|uniref:hypothetical protein n=1 Tax=Actinomycetospora sp. CA-084318 TaxID=3239892 RepID=UPI003D97C5CA
MGLQVLGQLAECSASTGLCDAESPIQTVVVELDGRLHRCADGCPAPLREFSGATSLGLRGAHDW